jgi:hypothetical protein
MASARLELIWNSISKGSGVLSLLSGVIVIALGLACLVPPFYMFSVFGLQLGEDLAADSSLSIVWLATLHGLLVFGMGGAAGLRKHRGFNRELLRSLPLRPSQLLLSELPFGLLDTIPMLGLAFFGGLGFGLARSQPSTVFFSLMVTGLGVLGVLLVQQLVSVLRRLMGRPRSLGIGVGLATVPVLAMVGLSATQGLKPAFFLVLEWLPTTMGYRGLRAWLLGDKGAAAGFFALSVAFVVTLFVLTAWLQLKELGQDPPLRTARRGKENLWSFTSTRVGVGRLFVAQVLGARYGKLLMILPLFVTGGFALAAAKVQYVAAGSVMEQLFDKAQSYPLYALAPPLVVLLGGGLWMNQFAWDGKGVKTLLLAPIPSTDILGGKLLGLTWILVPQSLLACLPLASIAAPQPVELVTGATSAMFLACALGTVGHVFSARFPRPLAESGTGVASVPFTLQLMSTALLVALGLVGLGTYAGLHKHHEWAPAAGFVLLTAVVLVLRRVASLRLTREFDACRETLAETLS